MSLLQGCSELQEAARLMAGLLKPKREESGSISLAPVVPVAQPVPPAAVAPAVVVDENPLPTMIYRGDRLEYILSSMCKRGGLIGAVVADAKGLPLSDFNSPVGGEILAAFTSVLGSALERAATLLGESGAEVISMDINYTDKIVLRRFPVAGEHYFLLVICPQTLDERTEIELSIEQITTVLTQD